MCADCPCPVHCVVAGATAQVLVFLCEARMLLSLGHSKA